MGVLTDIMGAGKSFSAMRKKKNSGKRVGGSGNGSGSGDGEEQMAMYHSGGKVRKTGPARLKKGETVLTKGQMKRMKGRGGKKR